MGRTDTLGKDVAGLTAGGGGGSCSRSRSRIDCSRSGRDGCGNGSGHGHDRTSFKGGGGGVGSRIIDLFSLGPVESRNRERYRRRRWVMLCWIPSRWKCCAGFQRRALRSNSDHA
jgi:hypothetical protein